MTDNLPNFSRRQSFNLALSAIIYFSCLNTLAQPSREEGGKSELIPLPASPGEAEVIKCWSSIPPSKLQEQLVFPNFSKENRVFLPINNEFVAAIQNHGIKAWIETPHLGTQVLGTSVAANSIWCIIADENAKPENKLHLYRHSIETTLVGWEKIASVDTMHGIPNILVPITEKENRFLAFSNGLGFYGEEDRDVSFIAIYKLRGDHLEFESCLELPSIEEQPVCKKRKITYEPRSGETPTADKKTTFQACEANPKALWPSLWPPSTSSDYISITAPEAGLIWIIDFGKGTIKRTVNIFSLSKSDIEKLKPLKQIVLGTAFSPDGRLIVATRKPELVDLTIKLTTTAKAFKPSSDSSISQNIEEDKSQEDKNFRLMADSFKEIQWWSINPETGTMERIDSPIIFPEQMPSFVRQSRLQFLVDANGYIRTNAFMPWGMVLESAGIEPPSKPSMNTESASKKHKTTNR